jgi:HEPN domain-containing protein
VDFYENAVDVHDAAKILCDNGKYRMSVFNACLAAELYLKSRLHLVEYPPHIEGSHDVINIYRCLLKRFPSTKDLTTAITFCRKYFNEARYPYGGTDVYTIEFATVFLGYVNDIMNYINNECMATICDLKRQYEKE